jgi:saccharopine dehydrogenase-like NADP-dependent oxidoreductase
MKVIALGGAGQEGSRTVRDLAASAQVESVVIGDLDIDAANRLKQEIGSDKVSTVQVDATDKAGLIEVLKGVRNVTQKGGCLGLDDIMRAFRELGLTSEEPLQLKGATVRPSEVAAALLGRMPEPDPSELPPAVSEFMLLATGTRGGQQIKLTYGSTGKMGPQTGIPASIAAQMIGAGQVQQQGVFAPEGCLDADIFIAELAKRDIEVTRAEEII